MIKGQETGLDAATVERCAQIAETYPVAFGKRHAIASAIRSLIPNSAKEIHSSDGGVEADGLCANVGHDWHIWPETDGQEQRCWKCGAYRKTPVSAVPQNCAPAGTVSEQLRKDAATVERWARSWKTTKSDPIYYEKDGAPVEAVNMEELTSRAALSSPAPDRLSEEERDIIACAKQNSDVGRDDRIADLLAIIDRLSRQPEAEPVAWQWKHHDPISGNVVWRKQQFWNGHRSTEQRALYTSPRLDRERLARALCKSGKFDTGQGTCALVCMDQLGDPRKSGCSHCITVHGALADAIMRETR